MALKETTLDPRGSCNIPLGACAIFNNGQSRIDCHVRSFSITGARLALTGTPNLPDEFLLEIPGRQKAYRAGLRWKSRDAAGVRFLGEISMESRAVAVSDETVEGLQLEVQRLRRENEELTAKLAELGYPPAFAH